MLNELVAQYPNPLDLLSLTPQQIDAILLSCVARRANDLDITANKFVYEGEIGNLYPIGVHATFQQHTAIDAALMESWQRLQSAGLIMQAPGQATGNMTVTTRGREVTTTTNVSEIMARQTLRRETLHPLLRTSVYDNFAGGHYDTAVRDAFVLVEDTVKTESRIASQIGVSLMRAAFNPNTGPLTKMGLPIAERERMADLFAGAIGTFKNPHSHRVVGNDDPTPVMEELMLASRLLRFLRP
jgi:uncharacterized protein (TIGR02391 family)